MVSFLRLSDHSKSQCCSCCGHWIRMLGDPQILSLFLGIKSAQRRAFQCVNCGQVLCQDCCQDGYRCACGCNAWVAVPYFEESTTEADEQLLI